MQKAEAAKVYSSKPAPVDEASYILGATEEGKRSVQSAEVCDISDVGAAQLDLPRVERAARPGLQGVDPSVSGLCLSQSSVQSAIDS